MSGFDRPNVAHKQILLLGNGPIYIADELAGYINNNVRGRITSQVSVNTKKFEQ